MRKIDAEGAKSRGGERNRAEADRRKGQPPVLDEIAERHNEQEPGAVADLRHRHDQPGRLRREAKRLRDRSDQRLRVVDIGDDEAAGRSEQEDRADRNLRLRRELRRRSRRRRWRQSRRFHVIQ
jgi:hypothetical protein